MHQLEREIVIMPSMRDMEHGSMQAMNMKRKGTQAAANASASHSSMSRRKHQHQHKQTGTSWTKSVEVMTRGKAFLATLLKFYRVYLLIFWKLLGYLFEAVMVFLSIVPAFLDWLVCSICVLLGKVSCATDFAMTAGYSTWLNETYMIVFETEKGRRQKRRVKKAEKLYRKELFDKAVTNGLLKSATAKSLDVRSLDKTSTLVFVFTDIEGSTQAQLQSPSGYQQAVLKHDIIIRDALYSNRGLELDTEGDAFRLAFGNVVDAVKFCMDFQESLLHCKWPKSVTKMTVFKIKSEDGNLLFAGPRVRMGIHAAVPGTFDVKFNMVTNKPVISGPSWRAAHSLGDVGSGGQILISDTVWSLLQQNLSDVGFPSIKHSGAYVFDDLPEVSMDIFSIASSYDSGILLRKFGDLRRCRQLARAVPIGTVGTPPQGEIAVVALRASQYETLTVQPSLTSFRRDPKAVADEQNLLMEMSEANNELLIRTILAISQQFTGYRFKVENQCEEDCFMAFKSVADACRFCISLQVALVCADWPDEPKAHYINANLIYRGPTVACAIHATNTDEAEFYNVAEEAVENYDKKFAGAGVDGLLSVLNLGNAGQILLTQSAWLNVQYCSLLGELDQPFPIDCGLYDIPNLGVSQVVEILPRVLKGRVFNDPSCECFAPGARRSPVSANGVAFVFTCPALGNIDTAKIPGIVEEAIEVFQNMTRQLVYARDERGNFYGYECQEVGPGNFMLAFESLELAMNYATNIQEKLLDFNWDPQLLQRPGFEEQKDGEGRLMQRGLRVSIGVAFGYPHYMMPHPNTGRADYFGPIVNLCARVKQAAKPGQILVALKSKDDKKRKKTQDIIKKYAKNFELISLGKHTLRGINGTVALAELVPRLHKHRVFGFGGNLSPENASHIVNIGQLAESKIMQYQDKVIQGLLSAEKKLLR